MNRADQGDGSIAAEGRRRLEVERDLQERVKELSCLIKLELVVGRCGRSLVRLLRGAAGLLLRAYQYPQAACAQISCGTKRYRTPDFRETRWKQSASIRVDGKKVGSVEVFYLEEMPPADEGPFLGEERALIDTVALRLGRALRRIQTESCLRKASSRLQVERRALEESNIALRTILARIEEEKAVLRMNLAANVETVLLPMLEAVESKSGPEQRAHLDLLKRVLEGIADPLAAGFRGRSPALTPAEMRVSNLIKMGLRSKEIARIRNVAPATVSCQRARIRRKLGLTGEARNLTAFLQGFGEEVSPADLPVRGWQAGHPSGP